jgi:hypothetical protein
MGIYLMEARASPVSGTLYAGVRTGTISSPPIWAGMGPNRPARSEFAALRSIEEAHVFERISGFAALVAADIATAAETYPVKLPSGGGEVVLPDEGAKKSHDEMRYAAVRRVGDIVNRRAGEGNDVAAFKLQARATNNLAPSRP